jgi:hypothetical protein
MLALTSCEGGELYKVNAPDWVAAKVDSIAEANKPEELVGMMDDYYTVGATDYSNGFWSAFSKYYVIPDGTKWNAEVNVYPNPDNVYYKNVALIVTNDADRGATNYSEYGAYRYDATGDSIKWNSQWGKLWFKYTTSTLGLSPDADNKDPNAQKLAGKMTLTVDRSKEGEFIIRMDNGSVVKTYNQPYELGSGENIRCFLVVDGSYLQFLTTNIEPIGGCTSKEDKSPVSLILNNVPEEIVQGSSMDDLLANVTATVNFEQGVVKENIPASELTFQTIPDIENLGEKTLVAVYSKTFKGENAATPVIAFAKFNVVPEIASIAITKAPSITTYYVFTSEYTSSIDRDLVFNPAGLQITATYVDGSKAVIDNKKLSFTLIPGSAGTYSVEVKTINGKKANIEGIKVVETSDFTTVHPKPTVLGPEDNSGGWWTFFSDDINIPAGKTYKMDFTNYGGGSNWNNWNIVLRKANMAEYGVVRADNYGWGSGYEGNPFLITSGGQSDWGAWLAAMSEAQVTVYITNIGNGMIDIIAVMNGADGNTYFQYYLGILADDANDINFAYVIDGDHLVFK